MHTLNTGYRTVIMIATIKDGRRRRAVGFELRLTPIDNCHTIFLVNDVETAG